MTTSSSDRCTRISPSAVLDDRLDGKDLEWARDHLRRCESCRERVEEFREMLLRVGRLPKATVGSAAIDEAYALSVPERLREEAGIRSFELAPAETSRIVPPLVDIPMPMRPEVTSSPDLMSELEREIFHDEPAQDHPTRLAPIAEPVEPIAETTVPVEAEPDTEPEIAPAPSASETPAWREVAVDSHRVEEPPVVEEPGETDWTRLLERIANSPEPEALPAAMAPPSSSELLPPVAPTSSPEPVELEPAVADAAAAMAKAQDEANRNVIFDAEPALQFDEPEAPAAATPPPKSDRGMRLLVGFGAAAVVLLAALLYEGGLFKLPQNLSATVATARASAKASPSPARVKASATAVPTPSALPATVLYTLGNGVAGNSVFRIRPGTAVAGYTRLVFDMHGRGLPSMLITQSDPLHVQVIFKNTTVTGVPVNGIASSQVAAVQPGVQSGPDGSFTIVLNRPARVTAFTLPATGAYAWRLVVDLHS